MSLKKKYIVYWVLNVLAALCIIPFCIGLRNPNAGTEWCVVPTVFIFLFFLASRLLVHFCFRCPYCGKELYTVGIRANIHLSNPWKGCPHCGHDLD